MSLSLALLPFFPPIDESSSSSSLSPRTLSVRSPLLHFSNLYLITKASISALFLSRYQQRRTHPDALDRREYFIASRSSFPVTFAHYISLSYSIQHPNITAVVWAGLPGQESGKLKKTAKRGERPTRADKLLLLSSPLGTRSLMCFTESELVFLFAYSSRSPLLKSFFSPQLQPFRSELPSLTAHEIVRSR